MSKNKNCKQDMIPHVKRFFWGLNPYNLFRPWVYNPYYINEDFPDKKRNALQDLLPGHSLTNLFVEFCRACPYIAGHIWLWQTLFTIVGILIWINT